MRRNTLTIAIGVLLALALVLAGCVTRTHSQIETLKRPSADLRILLMPLDVELSELSAGGLKVLNAEWTQQALKHMAEAIRSETAGHGVRFVDRIEDASTDPRELQISALHGVVGQSILVHKFLPQGELPSKQGKFDWSLGPEVRRLRERYGADYALFVYMRDSYTSGGRVAVILIAALFGASVQGGSQVGFASLVDLETGNVVWFNVVARSEGDLRTPEPARETVRHLIDGLPK
ncbi:MAG: hypothetical protein FJX53_10455 [Alphaproteobacteria bacterium]|nr:hypothetical protein [Alphaproteobacteria bacterium]